MKIPTRTLTLSLLFAGTAAAQVSITGSSAVNSQYQWRGVTTTNRPVIQPQVTATVPVHGMTLGATVFASAEAGRYDDPARHISENGGQRAGFAEYDLVVEAGLPVRGGRLTLGGQRFWYPNVSGTTPSSNTSEAYVRADLSLPLAPSIAVYRDVERVQGSYAEVVISRSIGHVSLAALGGWNFGQSVNDGGTSGYFTQHGMTHADFSATTAFTIGGVTASPSIHVITTRDANTRVATPTRNHAMKVWVGTTLSVARIFGHGAASDASTTASAAEPTQH